MKLDNSKRSLILEATHTRETGRLRISSGYRGEVSFLHSQVDNHFRHPRLYQPYMAALWLQ